MGARASEYAALAPHNSYVHVEEFASPEELAAYLRRLDEDDNLYNSYFKWKVKNIEASVICIFFYTIQKEDKVSILIFFVVRVRESS